MAFKGLRVFMSRKDFPPQFIDSAHDMLRENGAEVCICSNVSCNASTDFHVLPPFDHEKLAEYRSNGCNVIGPDCLLGCAKEHRPFPRQGYTCCLAMEGVKVLATGFEKAEKAEIERIVTSMCGEVETKMFTNISFVIAKDVQAAKYKFAVNNLRKPTLRIDWLYQCHCEHRLVPCEPFRLPPFAGLIICATNIPLDERKDIEDACIENGGSYSADLTKKCTHLIANIPQGDKFRVARRWGTVKIVNRQWFGQCLAAKACLDEDLFPVNSGKEKLVTVSQISGPPPSILSVENTKMESVLSSAFSLVSNSNCCDRGLENEHGFSRPDNSLQNEEKSLSLNETENVGPDDDSMYLSNCRVYICGFPAPDLRKYVKMVREGGGTRFMEFNERVTHVILGTSMDSSERDIRQSSWVGSIHFVLPLWLEECYQQRKEISVAQRHIAMEDILQKASSLHDKLLTESKHSQPSGKHWSLLPESSEVEVHKSAGSEEGVVMGKNLSNGPHEWLYTSQQRYARDLENSGHACEPTPSVNSEVQLETINLAATEERAGQSSIPNGKAIFNGYAFAISDSFPVERRAEIVQWVTEGGGFMKNEGDSQTDTTRKIDFVVVTHGSRLTSAAWGMKAKPVSSHWIRFCLEEEKLLDLESHVLYQPLRCRVPFPGFEALRLCVSQYEEKERLLLRNLCFVLGAKFTEKLTKKVTHLVCKVKDGQKYHAACSWGISITTADWLFGCATKDEVLPLSGYQPRELSAAEKGGTLGMTQGPIQTSCPAEMGSERTAELDTFGFQVANKGSRKTKRPTTAVDETMTHLSERNKYFLMMTSKPSQNGASLFDPWDAQTAEWSEVEGLRDKISEPAKSPPMNSKEADNCNGKRKRSRSPAASIAVSPLKHLGEHATKEQPVVILDGKETQHSSDVAAAIEGLLAQTSKLKGQTGADSLSIDQEISPEHTTIKRPREERRFKRPKHRPISSEKCIPSTSLKSPSKALPAFDESLMESQVIGYGEDRSGKELIIERVRTRSMSTIGDSGRLSAAAAWRNDGLGRLFKVAEDNK